MYSYSSTRFSLSVEKYQQADAGLNYREVSDPDVTRDLYTSAASFG